MDTPPPDKENPNAPSGDILSGRFELLEELGSGSSGTVFRALTQTQLGDVSAGTEVAVKFIRQDLAGHESAQRQLLREGKLGLKLRSPYIVRIHGVETVDVLGMPLTYLVMEFVEGKSLRAFLQETGPVLGDLGRRVGEHAARGLAALHGMGMVHRDVKPENLLLTAEGSVKLMDLGLARAGGAHGRSSSSGFFGSLAYAAPEVLRGMPSSPESDLWALGIVLYEVVTGQHPFATGREGDAVLEAILNEEVERPSHLQPRVSDFLEQVILDLLQKDPKSRPGKALEIAQILEAGERSRYWLRHVRQTPTLDSQRRLKDMRRSTHTRFFGRRDERRRLDHWLRRASKGQGRAIMVLGARGSGRRRLLDEAIANWLSQEDELVFLGGIADSRTTAQRGTPFTSILVDWLLRGDLRAFAKTKARFTARLHLRFGWEEGDAARLATVLTGQEDETSPLERAELISRALLQIIDAHRGVVLRIDHFEHLGHTAQLVAERLAREVKERSALLLFVTNRQEDTDEFPGEVLAIHGLDRRTYREFARHLFLDRALPESLKDHIHGTLSGMPGSLIDSLEDLRQRKRLQGRPGKYHSISEIGELRPARPALQRLRTQILSLPASRRYIVQGAAVLGRQFQVVDLIKLSGRPEIEVLQALAAFDSRLVHAVGGRGAFRHRDYRLAVLDATPAQDRFRLHRAAAWVLEDRGAAALEVGMHLSRAAEHEACLQPLLRAMEQLTASGSRKAARRIGERIRLHLNNLPRTPPNLEHRLAYLELSGQIEAQLDKGTRAARNFRKANLIAGHLGNHIAKARALIGLGELEQGKGHFLSAVQLLRESESLLFELDSPEALHTAARAYGVHSRVMAYRGQTREALHYVREALRRVPSENHDLRANLTIDLARWEALRHHFTIAQKNLDRAAALADQSAHTTTRLRLHLHRGRILGWLGQLDASAQDLDQARDIALRLSDTRMLGRVEVFTAELALYIRDRKLAKSSSEAARSYAETAGDRVTADLAEAFQSILESTDVPADFEDDKAPVVSLTWQLAKALALRRVGETDLAQDVLDRATSATREIQVPLPLRLALLRAAGRRKLATNLIQSISERLPAGTARRRFVSYAARVHL